MAVKSQLDFKDRTIYRDVFRVLDNDGNGWLSREELKIGLCHLGYRMTDQQAEKLFREMDENEDGKISFEEFLAVMGHIETTDKPLSRKDVQKFYLNIFNELDDDGNGWLSRDELKQGLIRLGYRMSDRQMEKLFREMDENEDGKITFDEFLSIKDRIETTDQSFQKSVDSLWTGTIETSPVGRAENGKSNADEKKLTRLQKSKTNRW